MRAKSISLPKTVDIFRKELYNTLCKTFFEGEISKMKKIADFFAGLPWIALLLLVIFFDGLVGGAIRIGNGKSTASKVVGWILFISFILNIISFAVAMPAVIAWVLHVLYAICWIADIITVAVSKKITLFM